MLREVVPRRERNLYLMFAFQALARCLQVNGASGNGSCQEFALSIVSSIVLSQVPYDYIINYSARLEEWEQHRRHAKQSRNMSDREEDEEGNELDSEEENDEEKCMPILRGDKVLLFFAPSLNSFRFFF